MPNFLIQNWGYLATAGVAVGILLRYIMLKNVKLYLQPHSLNYYYNPSYNIKYYRYSVKPSYMRSEYPDWRDYFYVEDIPENNDLISVLKSGRTITGKMIKKVYRTRSEYKTNMLHYLALDVSGNLPNSSSNKVKASDISQILNSDEKTAKEKLDQKVSAQELAKQDLTKHESNKWSFLDNPDQTSDDIESKTQVSDQQSDRINTPSDQSDQKPEQIHQTKGVPEAKSDKSSTDSLSKLQKQMQGYNPQSENVVTKTHVSDQKSDKSIAKTQVSDSKSEQIAPELLISDNKPETKSIPVKDISDHKSDRKITEKAKSDYKSEKSIRKASHHSDYKNRNKDILNNISNRMIKPDLKSENTVTRTSKQTEVMNSLENAIKAAKEGVEPLNASQVHEVLNNSSINLNALRNIKVKVTKPEHNSGPIPAIPPYPPYKPMPNTPMPQPDFKDLPLSAKVIFPDIKKDKDKLNLEKRKEEIRKSVNYTNLADLPKTERKKKHKFWRFIK